MTIITITVCLSIAALVAAIIFVPGVASALMTGLSLGMFRAIGETRAKRIKERRENGGRGLLGLRRRPGPEPEPEVPPVDKPLEQIQVEMLEADRRFRGLRERLQNRN